MQGQLGCRDQWEPGAVGMQGQSRYRGIWVVKGRRGGRGAPAHPAHTNERTADSAGDTAPGIRLRRRRGGRTDRTACSAGDTAPVTADTASQGRTFRRWVTTPTSR